MSRADGPNRNREGGTPQPHAHGSVLADRYEILNPLGHGAMGFVYQGFDRRLNRIVAIKALSAELELDDESRKRFEAEARVASNFNHPNVAAVYDYGLDTAGLPYIVMEFVDGESLEVKLSNGRKLREDETVQIFSQVAEGLHHAHKHGVIHRDLKPGNILVTKDVAGKKIAKLVDFGLAKVLFSNSSTRLTKTGDVLGTPLYMSPEQITGQELDERTDIYSLGCVIYHSLTGGPPFRGKDAIATAHLHVTAAMPPLELDESPENARLIAIVRRCMEKKKTERFTNALDLADALSALLPERTSLIMPAYSAANAPKPQGGFSPLVIVLLAITAISLCVAAFFVIHAGPVR